MRTIIIEDETAAQHNLRALLSENYPEMEIVAVLESVTETVSWLKANEQPELVFMDIHLADGNAFKIFDSAAISCPIIFTTAYDQYALEAFRVNSIDYLLKPISQNDLNRAITKLRQLSGNELKDYTEQINGMIEEQRQHSHTFLVSVRDRIVPLKADDVAFFYTCEEKVTAYLSDGATYPIDKPLEGIMQLLSKKEFFRANRQYIVHRSAIKDISVWFGSRLSLNMTVDIPEKIIISKARVPEFKLWLSNNSQ